MPSHSVNQRAARAKENVTRVRRRYKSNLTTRKRFIAGEEGFAKDMTIVLKLGGYSNSQIGAVVGVSRGQVRLFLEDPEVAEKLALLRASLPQAALDLLHGYMIEAVQAIADVMRKSLDDKTVLQAASEILDRGGLGKVSKSDSIVKKTEEHKFTDDGIVEAIRQLSPEKQEEAAQIIENLEQFLTEASNEAVE